MTTEPAAPQENGRAKPHADRVRESAETVTAPAEAAATPMTDGIVDAAWIFHPAIREHYGLDAMRLFREICAHAKRANALQDELAAKEAEIVELQARLEPFEAAVKYDYARAIEYAKQMGLLTTFPDAAIDAAKKDS